MDDGRHDLAVSGAVASQFVGDQLPGRTALPLQQLAEESFGGFLITARLDEDIDYITILDRVSDCSSSSRNNWYLGR